MSLDNYPPTSWEHLRSIVAPLAKVAATRRLLIKGGAIVSMDKDVWRPHARRASD